MTQLTPERVLNDCVRVIPAFREFWDTDDNLFREEDGSFTAGGVYAQFSQFLREKWRSFGDVEWAAMATMVREHYQQGEPLRGILGACLIENLNFEECAPTVARVFDQPILKRFGFDGSA